MSTKKVTASTPVLVALANIDPNPYQPRQGVSAARVKQIAESISEHGLLQIPTGRLADPKDPKGRVELAFGHTRFKSIQHLFKNGEWDLLVSQDGKPNGPAMYIHIEPLINQQMFEFAITENSQREDLTTTERARAMVAYRDEFEKTSKDIATLFGVSASTVRGLIRLLDLPAPVHKKMDEGNLPESSARLLLSLKAISPEAVETTMNEIVDGEYNTPGDVAELIQDNIQALDNSQSFDVDEDGVIKPDWTTSLWEFNATNIKPRNKLTLKVILDAFPELHHADIEDGVLKKYLKSANAGNKSDIISIGDELAEKFSRLVGPPPCHRCPIQIKISGTNYCGMAQCFKRKKMEWVQLETERLSDELNIQILNKKVDKDVRKLDWNDHNYDSSTGQRILKDSLAKKLKENPDKFRLRHTMSNSYSAHPFTNHYFVELLMIDSARAKKEKKEKLDEKTRDANRDTERAERQRRNLNAELSKVFLWQHLVDVGAPLLEGLTNPHFLECLADSVFNHYGLEVPDIPKTKDAKNKLFRRMVMFVTVWDHFDWDDFQTGPVHFTTSFYNLLKTWGVKPSMPLDQSLQKAGDFVNDNTEPDDEDETA